MPQVQQENLPIILLLIREKKKLKIDQLILYYRVVNDPRLGSAGRFGNFSILAAVWLVHGCCVQTLGSPLLQSSEQLGNQESTGLFLSSFLTD